MGSGVSSATTPSSESSGTSPPIKEYSVRELPEQIEQSIYIDEKFPLIIDPTNKARLFLKYQLGSFIKQTEFHQTNLNRALVGAIIHGRTLTISFEDLKGIAYEFFEPKYFPKEILNRSEFYKDGVWQTVFHPTEGDPDPQEVTPSPEFIFILCTTTEYVPPDLYHLMKVIKVVDKETTQPTPQGSESTLDEIAQLYGATEVIRNSTALVESGFDGDIPQVQDLIEKGYYLESIDGRKHTALSEAACQGHIPMIEYLLSLGANPNTMNDTGRTPLWRAAFNGHIEVAQILLNAGGDPDSRDTSSMETCYDVAKTEELRDLICKWDRKLTEELKEKRRKEIEAAIESRIKTSAEREEYARQKLRKEAVDLATKRDLVGLKTFFQSIVQEAEQTRTKPRVTVECRNDSGQSLLSIAAQNNDLEMVEFLLTHWKQCDTDRWDLTPGELSMEAKVFKTNPNTRDLKGWTPTCIAVFHNSYGALQLLLEHQGDPTIKSSYNKNAWDLAKDEFDAAGKIVQSRHEIRQILVDHENSMTPSSSKVFGNNSISPCRGPGDVYQDLDHNGSPIVMQLEMEGLATPSGGTGNGNEKNKNKKNSGNGKKNESGTNNTSTKKKKTTGKK